MSKTLDKTIVIMGPTASGKSGLAIALARQYNGEIISADSRQVYRGMDIGTGKVSRDKIRSHPERSEGSPMKDGIPRDTRSDNHFFSEGVRHHLLDVASPKRNYNVTHFVRDAKRAITDIKKRGKTPIICGGTGFWIQALVEDHSFPAVKPNPELRKKLGKLSPPVLFRRLQKKDSTRAANIDPQNKIRLIRALEICATLGTVPPLLGHPERSEGSPMKDGIPRDTRSDTIIIALTPPQETLYQNIAIRLDKRLRKGMLAEVKRLRADGVSFKKLESFGLEYKYLALFLQKKISKEEMKERLNFEIRHYAKRQLTWLRRYEKMGARIHWITRLAEAQKILQRTPKK